MAAEIAKPPEIAPIPKIALPAPTATLVAVAIGAEGRGKLVLVDVGFACGFADFVFFSFWYLEC